MLGFYEGKIMTKITLQALFFKRIFVASFLAFACFIDSSWGQELSDYYVDPNWPKPLPNNWKIGGVMGVAIDRNGDIWVYNRPNDLTALELRAEPSPSIAVCCVRPPAMIHFDAAGNV
ncbi:MAG: hypothetical protein CMM56_08615, partial [Rhodospirillaceae bacterium]|nr:hypothetical protein [Rhodospirillaceae bacterium]